MVVGKVFFAIQTTLALSSFRGIWAMIVQDFPSHQQTSLSYAEKMTLSTALVFLSIYYLNITLSINGAYIKINQRSYIKKFSQGAEVSSEIT